MSQDATPAELAPPNADATELKVRIGAFVDALVHHDDAAYEEQFVHLLTCTRALVDRKLRMDGRKSDTRDVLGELMFTRLRQAMLQFVGADDARQATKAAAWAMGALCAVGTLQEFAKAFDESLLRASADARDFNFAGRTDFICVEEVLQMLAAGKHLGCLSLEKADNRLDIFLKDGRIVLLDPHHVVRRVLPGDSMRHRELSEAMVHEAETRRVRDGVPALIALVELGACKPEESRELLRAFGKEMLFEFMREETPFLFSYRRLDALPANVEAHDIRVNVTAALLEGSKLNDDWKRLQQAFPDLDAPIEPCADMFARLANTPLSVLEIKLLSLVQGDTSPRAMVSRLGLPIFDVCEVLARLARLGIVTAAVGPRALLGVGDDPAPTDVKESVRAAMQALDANDDQAQRRSAIDRVFGATPATSALSALDKALDKALDGKDGDGGLDQQLLRLLKRLGG